MSVETTNGCLSIAVRPSVPPRRARALPTGKPHVANRWGNRVDLQARPGGTVLETRADGGCTVSTFRSGPPAR